MTKPPAQHSIRVEWLEQQLKSKEEMIAVLNDRLLSSESLPLQEVPWKLLSCFPLLVLKSAFPLVEVKFGKEIKS